MTSPVSPLATVREMRNRAELAVAQAKDDCDWDLATYYEGKRDGFEAVLDSLDGTITLTAFEAKRAIATLNHAEDCPIYLSVPPWKCNCALALLAARIEEAG